MTVKEEKEGMGDEESGSKLDGRSEIPYKVKAGAFLTTAAGWIFVFKVSFDYYIYETLSGSVQENEYWNGSTCLN